MKNYRDYTNNRRYYTGNPDANPTNTVFLKFHAGQNVLYRICEPPFDEVKEYKGTVQEVHRDYLIVDIPDISDHCRFEDFNIQFLCAAPLSDNERLASDVWEVLYNVRDASAEDKSRIISELADELDHCGEDAFMLRQVLRDLVNTLHVVSIYGGDVEENAWNEILDDLGVSNDDDDINEILLRGFYVDHF